MSDNNTQSLPKKPRHMWTRRQIYDMITYRIGHALLRYINPNETVANMFYEADLMDVYLENGGAITAKLTKQLHHIEKAFCIQIYADYTLNDIESVAEWMTEKRGYMALAPTDGMSAADSGLFAKRGFNITRHRQR